MERRARSTMPERRVATAGGIPKATEGGRGAFEGRACETRAWRSGGGGAGGAPGGFESDTIRLNGRGGGGAPGGIVEEVLSSCSMLTSIKKAGSRAEGARRFTVEFTPVGFGGATGKWRIEEVVDLRRGIDMVRLTRDWEYSAECLELTKPSGSALCDPFMNVLVVRFSRLAFLPMLLS